MVPAFLEGEIKTDVKNTKIRRQLNLNRLCWDVFNCTHPHTHTHTHSHSWILLAWRIPWTEEPGDVFN